MTSVRPAIARLVLRSADVEASSSFLRDHLGDLDGVSYVPVGEVPASLPSYWKYSVFCDDVDVVRARAVAAGAVASEPVQFGDIGYLCHLTEPGGNAVELLQRTFAGAPPLAVASQERLGLVTLRISDPVASGRFYAEALGMRLLATMVVDDGRPDPFDLYFYAFGDDTPPDLDPSAVANRPWLYQRPYALIELQHYRSSSPTLPSGDESDPGLTSIDLVVDDVDAFADRLARTGMAHERSGAELRFRSPDGHLFICRSRPG